MINPVLIVPFNPDLLSQIGGRRVIVRTASPAAVDDIIGSSGKHSNRLECIRVEIPGALTDLPFSKSWIGVPIVAAVRKLGNLARLAEQLPLLRNLSLTVFLPSDTAGGYRDARILSSLMIASGITLSEDTIDWTLLGDLMHYAVYGKVKHAPIEPFHYIAAHYSPTGLTDFGTLYLADPSQFLHCNETGDIALSHANLLQKNFITTIKDLDTFLAGGTLPGLIARKADFFYRQNPDCLSCPAWRVCLGAFSRSRAAAAGCREFFSDLQDATEFAQEREKQNPSLWQP